jgi:ribonuclease Y
MKYGKYALLAKNIIHQAEQQASALLISQELALKQRQIDLHKEAEQLIHAEKRKFNREEERLKKREEKLEERLHMVDAKQTEIAKKEGAWIAEKNELEEEKKRLILLRERLLHELEHSAGLSAAEAKDFLIARMKNEIKADSANLIRRTMREAEEEGEQRARKILATVINRLAVDCASTATVNTVAIPNEEIKGRIIGREGRNVRSLEQETGVSIIVDDTPGAVVLSSYDPIRMQVAKIALAELVADGRIYPTRIEEVVEKARNTVAQQIKYAGEDAALRAGIMNLHPEILTLLGKLKFRFSYGQNVLEHSLEVSRLLGMMAAELGLDIELAKRIGLLHDMGKAVSHEIEGSHAIIGHDLALKYGESPDVANGIGCHHYEMEATTIEGSLCVAADAISASRPGARIEAIEEYVKRLKKLEEIATSFSGVYRAYAMQAGREVRVIVVPEEVDDDGLITLARDLTKRIEQEVSYPGKVKVTAIREKRVIHYAL